MKVADSHELIELWRGHARPAHGHRVRAPADDVRFVSFAPDILSPADRTLNRRPAPRRRRASRAARPHGASRAPRDTVVFAKKEVGGKFALTARLRPRAARTFGPTSSPRARTCGSRRAATRRTASRGASASPSSTTTRATTSRDAAAAARFFRSSGRSSTTLTRSSPSTARAAAASSRSTATPPSGSASSPSPSTSPVAPRHRRRGGPRRARRRAGRVRGRVRRQDDAHEGQPRARRRRAARHATIPRCRAGASSSSAGRSSRPRTPRTTALPNTVVTGMLPNEEPAAAIAAADVVAFPDVAHPGGFWSTVAETMAAAKPIVLGAPADRTSFR